ncbi:MAG: hypothetical protein K9L62_15930 [Vallitaleaceae bacterium]|nr:hypothetical protein [Vallitaleaceae bacterium]
MINLDDFLDNLYHEIKNYTGMPQLILGSDDIPIEEMVYPRGKMNFILKYNPQPRQSIIKTREVVPSPETEFDSDIEYTYFLQPDATLSLNFYGEDISEYVNMARQWFLIDKLGRRYFDSYGKCVIKEITPTENRKTFLETDYEDRQGFDVILGFSEKVKIIESTIEILEISQEIRNGIDEYELDI